MSTKGWSGERLETFVNNTISIEHLHRYSIAIPYVFGKRVLDIACGEGYGSHLLAETAEQVTGVDIDAPTIERARAKYTRPGIIFLEGSADQIPLNDQSVDVVVSFETIEHHDRHIEMMQEIKRVLKPGGILILSSPEAGVSGYNPHHVKELTNAGLKELVDPYFKHINYYYQRIMMGSMIVRQEPSSTTTSFHAGDYQQLTRSEQLSDPVYNLCIASDHELTPQGNSFFDGQQVIKDALLYPYLNSRLRKFTEWLKAITGVRSAHS